MFESILAGVGSEQVRVFVSYDREYDGDLHDLLVEQASKSTSGFEISARSRARAVCSLYPHGKESLAGCVSGDSEVEALQLPQAECGIS